MLHEDMVRKEGLASDNLALVRNSAVSPLHYMLHMAQNLPQYTSVVHVPFERMHLVFDITQLAAPVN